MADLPAQGFFTAPGIKNIDGKQGLEAVRSVVAQLPGGQPVESLTISSGSIAPARGVVRVDTEAGEPTDDLASIAAASLPEGSLLLLSIASASRVVRVRHQIGSAGQVRLSDGQDLTINGRERWLLLHRVGTDWEELARFGFPVTAQLTGQLGSDLDAGGFAIFNSLPAIVEVASDEITLGAAGTAWENWNDRLFLFTRAAGCKVKLPVAGRGRGFAWLQGGADLTFEPLSGVEIVHPLGHTKGYGEGSTGACFVYGDGSPRKWAISGFTKAGGAPASGDRTAHWQQASTAVSTSSANTDFVSGQTLGFSPGDNETWVMLGAAMFWVNDALNGPTVRLLESQTVEHCVVRPRGLSANHRESIALMDWKTYGAAPGAQDWRLQVANSTTGYTATLDKALMLALRLEADEFAARADGEQTKTSTAFSAVCTMSETFAADDYVFLAYAELGHDSAEFAQMRLLVDGVPYAPRDRAMRFSSFFPYFVAIPVAMAAGARTVELQLASSNGTARVRSARIVALKKSRFRSMDSDWKPAASATASTVLQTKATITKAMEDYHYLLLASANVHTTLSGHTDFAEVQIDDNGSLVWGPARGTGRNGNDDWTNGFALARVVGKLAASDTLSLKYRSSEGGNTVTIRDTSLILLPLTPA